MLVADYDIVFQEVPDETTLALNISECPHSCPGCHSAYLQQTTGEPLTEQKLDELLTRYPYVTCVSFQGGDGDTDGVQAWARRIKDRGFKTCWYSGNARLPESFDCSAFDYIKVGPYIEALGGLTSATTNQRFYRVENGMLIDMTYLFRRT